jgi:hypothetical protein
LIVSNWVEKSSWKFLLLYMLNSESDKTKTNLNPVPLTMFIALTFMWNLLVIQFIIQWSIPMSLSMYQASIPAFLHMLGNLSKILDKAAAHAEEKKIDPAIFVNARLAPDMFPLSRQVQIATDLVKACAARLAGIEVPSYEDNETTFAELQARIAKTAAFLQSVSAEQIDGTEDHNITPKFGSRVLSFSGQDYLLNFVIPNFHFHLTTVYAILRHNGVGIGKLDYTGEY